MSRARPWTRLSRLVLDQGVQVVLGEAIAAFQEGQLDDEAAADHLPAESLDELLADRLDGAARREHVVVDQNPSAGRDHVRVQLEGVLAVLKRVRGADRLRG